MASSAQSAPGPGCSSSAASRRIHPAVVVLAGATIFVAYNFFQYVGEVLDGFGFDTGRRNRRGERLTFKTLGRAIGLTVGTAGFIAIVLIALI